MTTPHSSGRLARAAGSLGLALVGLSPLASADTGNLDLTVSQLQVVQTLPNVTLVGGKPAMVRTVVGIGGTLLPGTEVDGLLRVFVDGTEAPYSPVYSDNGPFSPPLAPNIGVLNDTLNFVFLPPASNDVELIVELNPAGGNQVCETDYANNSGTTGSLTFQEVAKPEIVYVPIDYRPGGGTTPSLPPPDRIEPGHGDNFVQGMYPTGDWEYRISDAGSKLWTGSLSGSGSALLSSLLQDLLMMSPQPDFIYGWVRGTLPYNGQAIGIPGRAGMGASQIIRHQRTFAHELGHLFGRSHISNTLGTPGVDVEHHLNRGGGASLPQLKAANLFDVMVAGLLTNQAWVYPTNYNFFTTRPAFQPSEEAAASDPTVKLMVAGLWNRADGTVTLTDTVAFAGSPPTPTVPVDQADLVLRVHAGGQVAGEFGLRVNTTTDCNDDAGRAAQGDSDSWTGPVELGAFAAVLPGTIDPATIERLVVVDGASGVELNELVRSDSAPETRIVSPRPGTLLADREVVEWQAADADGDSLKHYVRYSPDGEIVVPLATGQLQTRHDLDLSVLPQPQAGKAWFEVLTSDGLRTTRIRTTDLGTLSESLGAGGNPPTAFILSPDDGKVFEKGATIMLHSSGWDLEDRALEGADIQWTSDIDGNVGSGRVSFATDLSVGTHLLTVTATDSGGQMATDTHSITIEGRFLPEATCASDEGFGNPGAALLEVCGEDLSAGTTQDLRLTGAPPSVTVYLAYGVASNPIPIPSLGGTLVPVPVDGILVGFTDSNGELFVEGAIAGGGGPIPFYVQAVYQDPGSATFFNFSNAVRSDILP